MGVLFYFQTPQCRSFWHVSGSKNPKSRFFSLLYMLPWAFGILSQNYGTGSKGKKQKKVHIRADKKITDPGYGLRSYRN
jgi:hypothetical protein